MAYAYQTQSIFTKQIQVCNLYNSWYFQESAHAFFLGSSVNSYYTTGINFVGYAYFVNVPLSLLLSSFSGLYALSLTFSSFPFQHMKFTCEKKKLYPNRNTYLGSKSTATLHITAFHPYGKGTAFKKKKKMSNKPKSLSCCIKTWMVQ